MPTSNSQPDLFCADCPLRVCDEKSLWCMYRFITSPNKAQREAAKLADVIHLTPKRARQSTKKRKKYYADYYMANRESKLKKANARYAAKKIQA